MPVFLTALLSSSLVRWLILGSFAGILSYATYTVRDYKQQAEKIVKLETQLSVRGNEIKVLQATENTYKTAIQELDRRLLQKTGDLDEFCKILWGVKKSTAPQADEKIGEPTSDVLEALKKREQKK